MENIRLLFITKDRSQQLERSTHYLLEELRNHVHVSVWMDHGNLSEIIAKQPQKPHFILLNDYKPDYCPFIFSIKEVDIPVGMIMHDLQYKVRRRKTFIEKEDIRYIFTHYRDAFLKRYPEFKDRMIWFPHHVPTHIFKDYGEQKTINWLFTGAAFPHIYPFRAHIIATMRTEQGFVAHQHPGYDSVNNKSKNVFVGEQYARELNRAKMLLTSQSVYQFPVLKYFEGGASHTLVMGNGSKELNDLGFIDGRTFVEINEQNLVEKAHYYLQHETERLEIASRAYHMVRQAHSTKERARQFVLHVQNIIKDR